MKTETKYNIGDILSWKNSKNQEMTGEVRCIKLELFKENVKPIYAMKKLVGDGNFYWIAEDQLAPAQEFVQEQTIVIQNEPEI